MYTRAEISSSSTWVRRRRQTGVDPRSRPSHQAGPQIDGREPAQRLQRRRIDSKARVNERRGRSC